MQYMLMPYFSCARGRDWQETELFSGCGAVMFLGKYCALEIKMRKYFYASPDLLKICF